MAARWLLRLLVLLAPVAAGCLGGLGDSRPAELVALAPESLLEKMPLHENHSDWLLRSEPGWCGARSLRYGGDSDDPASAEVRVILFSSPQRASHAFGRLTPAYLTSMYRDRISWPPRVFAYPEPLPGDITTTTLYGLRLPPPYSPEIDIAGQFTTVRAGRVVLVIDSVGVVPEKLVPAIQALVDAATQLPASGC